MVSRFSCWLLSKLHVLKIRIKWWLSLYSSRSSYYRHVEKTSKSWIWSTTLKFAWTLEKMNSPVDRWSTVAYLHLYLVKIVENRTRSLLCVCFENYLKENEILHIKSDTWWLFFLRKSIHNQWIEIKDDSILEIATLKNAHSDSWNFGIVLSRRTTSEVLIINDWIL